MSGIQGLEHGFNLPRDKLQDLCKWGGRTRVWIQSLAVADGLAGPEKPEQVVTPLHIWEWRAVLQASRGPCRWKGLCKGEQVRQTKGYLQQPPRFPGETGTGRSAPHGQEPRGSAAVHSTHRTSPPSSTAPSPQMTVALLQWRGSGEGESKR